MNPWTAARGRVFKRGHWWYLEVTDSEGKVVITDNGCWSAIAPQAAKAVECVREIEGRGHKIRYSFAELAERAARHEH